MIAMHKRPHPDADETAAASLSMSEQVAMLNNLMKSTRHEMNQADSAMGERLLAVLYHMLKARDELVAYSEEVAMAEEYHDEVRVIEPSPEKRPKTLRESVHAPPPQALLVATHLAPPPALTPLPSAAPATQPKPVSAADVSDIWRKRHAAEQQQQQHQAAVAPPASGSVAPPSPPSPPTKTSFQPPVKGRRELAPKESLHTNSDYEILLEHGGQVLHVIARYEGPHPEKAKRFLFNIKMVYPDHTHTIAAGAQFAAGRSAVKAEVML